MRTLFGSRHIQSRGTRQCHGAYGQSRRSHLVTAVHVGHVDVARSVRETEREREREREREMG